MTRHAYRMRVKEGFEQEYIRYHEEVLPGLLQVLMESGIRNYSIFMDGTDLFAYMECDDIDKAWAAVRSHPANDEWSSLLTPIMDFVDAKDSEPRMKPMREVFRLDEINSY
ncbi:L-rhamnose mutarotase [Cohnella silvisoli]|uniref:L-rhamnose mutarotase n=1 Tax=Cohnella silvisoli TaxID=2873699 RepID=A0ABV1KM27_9BACL|nr:L-rhamnose mutarotase [Cohnella silvisoli]MCD9020532.1 L-rhamnose mutarotase [Cohnella silvisoli]